MKKGYDLIRDAFLNKGTAFTERERKELGLEGLLPPCIEDIETQKERVYRHIEKKISLIDRRKFLMDIFNHNRTLFFYLFREHFKELMPVVGDPVIAESVEQYSEQFTDPQDAVFLSIDEPDQIESILKSAADGRDIRLMVVTDSEGILDRGDWGVNGADVSVEKLMVYTAAAGIDPKCVMPVVLDCGTDNEALLGDYFYLGNHHKRVQKEQYYKFIIKFVETAEKIFPDLYIHFEDFGMSNAIEILEVYKDAFPVFSDGCQGTGLVTLAGILGAMDINKEKLTDQKYMCFGSGIRGTCITDIIFKEMRAQGLSETEARKRFFIVGKDGLLFDDMEGLTPVQKPFVRKRSEFKNADELTTLEKAVMAVQPTILIGTSEQQGAFTEDIVKAMASWCEHPVIFSLSSTAEFSEAKAADIINWSHGRAMVATGAPSDPVEYNGITYDIGQLDDALIYPGIGLGAVSVKAKLITDEMLSAAAHALCGFLEIDEYGPAVLPPVEMLIQFSESVAEAVADCAVKQGENRLDTDDAAATVKENIWLPEYLKYENGEFKAVKKQESSEKTDLEKLFK